MDRGLLSEQMPQDQEMVEEAPMPAEQEQMPPAEGMSDVDMAVEEAMASGGMEDTGFGTVMASEEEQQRLNQILDEIDLRLHGQVSENVTGIIESQPEAFQGIAQAAHTLVLASYKKAAKDGLDPTMDMYVAENGIIQQTVEMVFEVAEAMGKVSLEDDEVLSAAYMDTLRRVGETLLNVDNPEIREGAQELMVELELDTPIGPEDYAEPSEMPQEGQPTAPGPEMAQNQSQGVSGQPAEPMAQPQGPMPPMGPDQGMV